MPQKIISKKRVASVLDAMTEIGGTHKIAKVTKVGQASVLKIAKDFPLWDFVRKQIRGPRKDD